MSAALGAALFTDNYLAQAVCVAASVIPDFALIPQYVSDRRAGRKPLVHQSRMTILLREIGHSIPLWVSLGVLFHLFLPQDLRAVGDALALGGLGHALVDVFTHGTGPKETRPYWETDIKSMWPFPIDLRPLGIWEYRIDQGSVWTKPQEASLLYGALMTAVALWIF